ncbi:hypothetical protein Micbo1qcDRAFT_211034 [Microdochium bolleyi]|uniref:Uncharacterized protein n=1 Tax=Microdochium bolleyi TaxID=196109 RepID=A0A136JI50_9PEZI|nr:hypothetical protein Micbo1qcDRAFT_211034 [Microdochium bolleyi]
MSSHPARTCQPHDDHESNHLCDSGGTSYDINDNLWFNKVTAANRGTGCRVKNSFWRTPRHIRAATGGINISSAQLPLLPEGTRAAIIAGTIFAAGLLVAIVLCSLRRRRLRAESPDFGVSTTAASASRAFFEGYSVDVPSSDSETRLVLSASLNTEPSRGRGSKPPLRLSERRILPIGGSRDNSPHGSLNTKSSAGEMKRTDLVILELLGSEKTISSTGLGTPVDSAALGATEKPGTRDSAQGCKAPGSWPLSIPPPVMVKNHSNTSLRSLRSCRTPPPWSPLPRLPKSPPGSPQPTSPLALMVSPPSSPRRPSAATTESSGPPNPFSDP